MKYICMFGLIVIAMTVSCGRGAECPVGRTDTVVAAEGTDTFDLERIRMLTGKRYFTPEEQDFMIEQYEIFCRETSGMDCDARAWYFKKKGPDSTVILYVVMDVVSAHTLNADQRERIDSINEKYNPEL